MTRNRILGYVVVLGFALVMALGGNKIYDFLQLPKLPLPGDQAAAVALAVFYILASAFTFRLSFTSASAKFGKDPEQGRINCLLSALGSGIVAALLIVLANSGPCGCIRTQGAVAMTAIAAVIFVVIDLYLMRHYPLHYRKMVMRSFSASMRIGFPLVILWAGFAQAGLSVGFTPLAVLTGLFALALIGPAAAQVRQKRR